VVVSHAKIVCTLNAFWPSAISKSTNSNSTLCIGLMLHSNLFRVSPYKGKECQIILNFLYSRKGSRRANQRLSTHRFWQSVKYNIFYREREYTVLLEPSVNFFAKCKIILRFVVENNNE
jgi:hypothetical protein